MDTAAAPGHGPNDAIEPWEQELDEIETEFREEPPYPSDIPSIIRRLLVSYPQVGQVAAQQAAQQVDHDYWHRYLPSNPLNPSYEDKGMLSWLSALSEPVLNLAPLIRYDDPKQEALVQLLVELHKLPPKQFKIWGEDHLIYTDDPVFTCMCADARRACHPRTAAEDELAKCINLASFLARCIGAGCLDEDADRLRYALYDIEDALEKDLPAGELGDCTLQVALQWILHIGQIIHDCMASGKYPLWNVARWRLWVVKLKEMEEGGTLNESIRSTAQRALTKMAEIDANTQS